MLSRRLNQTTKSDEDGENVIMSSLSELILFLLFFFLILLGNQADLNLDSPVVDLGPDAHHQCMASYQQCRTGGVAEKVCFRRAQQCLSNVSEWPPIIVLSDINGYTFDRGSSVLSGSFRRQLQRSIIPRLEETIDEKARSVTAIEIIGHTDEKAFVHDKDNDNSAEWGNLDQDVIKALDGLTTANSLRADDNAGLGLARAIAVREYLLKNGQFGDIPILVYSASYTIERDTRLATGALSQRNSNANRKRRRIEIRLRGPLKDVR